MDNKTTTNEEIVIENSEEWFVFLQRGIIFKNGKPDGDSVFTQHKLGMQGYTYGTLPLNIDINSSSFKFDVELGKKIALMNERTWGGLKGRSH